MNDLKEERKQEVDTLAIEVEQKTDDTISGGKATCNIILGIQSLEI